jgi:hypothetical protein
MPPIDLAALPTHLSAAFLIATLLPLFVGIINQLVQSKMIFGQWPLPTKALPWLTTLGSFLTGASALATSMSPLAVNAVTIVLMIVAGLYSLGVGSMASLAAHLHGAAVNAKRPPPNETPPGPTVVK